MTGYFDAIPKLAFEGPDSDNEFAFRHYDPSEMVLGKPLRDHLRFAVAYWHSFAGTGADPFGGPTYQRPWFGDDLDAARAKADAAFAMFDRLGQPYFCFHDVDVRPETDSLKGNREGLEAICDHFGPLMEATGTKLLWGTANLFSDRRFMAGAATNPDPDVFAWSAATVRHCMDATHRLGGENYVLWGGREGYETLLNTDLAAELDHLGRFLSMVVDYKHKIGFAGTILIEPKPKEPSKHQYDTDVATVAGFLQRHGLEGEVKLNIETGHAFLAGHDFPHEIALAASLGLFGSIDMNRNDWVSGWDTDQFPHDLTEVMLAYYEILRAGGFTTGGTNFDAKLRRQSLDAEDLVLAHAGAMDVCARAFKAAARAWEDGGLEAARAARYAGWREPEAEAMLDSDLAAIAAAAEARDLRPEPRSGQQERLERIVARYL